ncbi:methyltransferase domain protein [Ceratobasidium sp. AG-Ba]|nr:methyltransferase domain protein [Ceratobasidium sp. AG-Ba]
MAPLDENVGLRRIGPDDEPEIVDLSRGLEFDQASDLDNGMFSDSGSSHRTMSTIQSSEVADYFQSIYGTTFPSDDNVPILFPSGAEAKIADILLHVIIRLCRGGKHVPDEVDEVLRKASMEPEGAEVKVLDMVTDSGIWVKEMAEIYPAARFISLDNKPLIPHTPHPRIEFQVYDFQVGIMEPDDTFELVHVRRGVLITKDFNFMLREIHRVLKPKGFIVMTEIPFEKYEGIDIQIPLRSAPYFAQSLKHAYKICLEEGVDLTAWQDMSTRLDPTHPLWENELIGTPSIAVSQEEGREMPHRRGFNNISLRQELLPIGAWHPDDSKKRLGVLTHQFALHQMRSTVTPATERLRTHLGEKQTNEFFENLIQELTHMEKYQVYGFCYMWLARKI